MSLEKYNKKRNFDKTLEPKGVKKKNKEKNLRYVIQYHQARAKHYDFRLEWNGVLVSFAVPKGLPEKLTDKRLAIQVEDHPLDYINFKGIIPKGQYGAGTVEIWDKGVYLCVPENLDSGLKKGKFKFLLNGEKLKGLWTMFRTEEENWLIVKDDDEQLLSLTETMENKKTTKNNLKTKKQTKTKSSTKSTVKNNKKKRKIDSKSFKKNPFKSLDVKLASLTSTIPKSDDWLFEIKYDGYRIVSFIENQKVKLLTRNGKDYSIKFPSIVSSLKKISKNISMVLDGEVVVFDKLGRTDFSQLQTSIKNGEQNFCYVVFDIVAFNGENLKNTPLEQRKQILFNAIKKAPNNIVFSDYIIGKGKELFNFAKKNKLEGIVAKKLISTYDGNRDENWLKIKCYLRQEFVIGGYTTTEKNQNLSAVLVGYYDKERLICVGKVGTGFNDEQRKSLSKNFLEKQTSKCPFSNQKDIKLKNIRWIKPIFVAEIQYAEITNSGNLRQPSFIGLRQDKKPKEVVLEKKNAK